MNQGIRFVEIDKPLPRNAQDMAKTHQPLAQSQRESQAENEKANAPNGWRIILHVPSMRRGAPAVDLVLRVFLSMFV
jgi:hypothetical protein